jgi:hypothetical protein
MISVLIHESGMCTMSCIIYYLDLVTEREESSKIPHQYNIQQFLDIAKLAHKKDLRFLLGLLIVKLVLIRTVILRYLKYQAFWIAFFLTSTIITIEDLFP